MATTSPIHLPSHGDDTPAPDPYRLATSAVRLPREATTAELDAIRSGIQPRTAVWQFELRPWHYWTAIASTAVTTAAFIALIVTTGAIR